jgi:hypothetical protein
MTRLFTRLLPASIALVFISSASSLAQSTEAPPAHVSYTDGTVLVEHDATSEQVEPNTPLLPGDRIRTEAGRAEITFGDGSLVHLDEHTTLDLLSESLVRLLAGRVTLVAGSGLAGQLQLDAAAASVRVLSAGEYRVALLSRGDGGDLELAVIRGAAELIGDTTSLTVRAGERAVASLGGTPGGPWPFNSARFDAFDAWSQTRLDARRGPTSYQHVPPELRTYAGTFDTYGTWGYQPTYGYVWYPRVDHGWRPYYHGRWKHYRRFGWTWIGGPRWTWPTHHYGRWGFSSLGAWFWIPGRHWAPAWVHWGVAPGYVSWCPLGFDNRPVFGFWSRGHRFRHNPWRGWTVVHRSHFGHRRYVRAFALDGQRIVNTHPTSFVTQSAPPTFRGVGARSGRLAAERAVPRDVGIPHRSGRTAASSAAFEGPRRSGRTAAIGSRQGDRMDPSAPRASSVPMRSGRGRAFQAGSSAAGASGAATQQENLDRTQDGRGSAVSRVRPGARRAWRAEDIPVHRGQIPQTPVPTADDTSRRTGRSAAEPVATPPPPTYRSGRGGWGDGPAAVPRGREPSYTPPPTPASGDGAHRRGSIGTPSAPAHTAPPSSPPPARAGDGGRHERRAPAGSESGGHAVPRGEGGRGGARSRR